MLMESRVALHSETELQHFPEKNEVDVAGK